MILVSLQRGREGVDDMLPIYHGSLRNDEKTWECPSQPLPYKLDESRLLQSLAAKRRVFYTYLMQLKRRNQRSVLHVVSSELHLWTLGENASWHV